LTGENSKTRAKGGFIMNSNYKQKIEELRNALTGGKFEAAHDEAADETVDEGIISEYLSGFGSYKSYDFVAHVPSAILNSPNYCGYLHGIARRDTEKFYVIEGMNEKYPQIGYITNEDAPVPSDAQIEIIIIRTKDGVKSQTTDAHAVRIKPYDEQVRLFSRNSGLLESAQMLNKRALIIGCGAVGSFIALQLARSGVGKFVLCDTDTLEIHNICRHQCGFDDLGRYKVDAIRDKILNINPKAEIVTFKDPIQRIPKDVLLPLLGSDSVVIGAGDNRDSSRYACDSLAIPTSASFVAACCWTRAFAGEVIYWTSEKGLPCYNCALGDLVDSPEEIEREMSRINYFANDADEASLSFEPGIAVDIDFVSIVAVKIILDLLNKNTSDYTPRVINHLSQLTWICNTNERKIGGEKAGIFSRPLQITQKLSFARKTESCPVCDSA
jgi:molybdopterin/thiamine biosynthesis adenylyltransferase